MMRKLRNIKTVSNEDAVDLFRQALESLYASRERAVTALHRPRPRLKRSWTRLIYSSESELIEDFMRADADGSGGIDVDELAFVLPCGMTHEDVEQVFGRYCVPEDARIAEIFHTASLREGFSIKNLDDRVATYEEALNVGQRRTSLVRQVNAPDEDAMAAATSDASDGMVVTVAGYIRLARRLEVQRMAILCVTGMVMCYYFCFMRLVDSILGIFSFTLVEGEYRMTKEMTSSAFTPGHVMMMMVAPASGFVCIVLAPLLILVVLHINRRRHSDSRLRTMFGFILDGYADRYWYWEFVVLSRKLVIATCAHVLGMNMFLQNLIESVVVVVFLVAHCVVWPYDQQILNWLDAAGMLSLFCTLQGSLVFWRYLKAEEKSETLKLSVQVSVTVLLFAINAAMVIAFLITVARYKAGDIFRKIKKRIAKKKTKKDVKKLRASLRLSILARSEQVTAGLQDLRGEMNDSVGSDDERRITTHANPLRALRAVGASHAPTASAPTAEGANESVGSDDERLITTHTNPMRAVRASRAATATAPTAEGSVAMEVSPTVALAAARDGVEPDEGEHARCESSGHSPDVQEREGAPSSSPRGLLATGARGLSSTGVAVSSAEVRPARGRARTTSPRPRSGQISPAREQLSSAATRRASRRAKRSEALFVPKRPVAVAATDLGGGDEESY
jgi:hypothetical protein